MDDLDLDFAAVLADDEFLDALGAAHPIPDDELAGLLVAWRDDVDAVPITVIEVTR